MKPNLSQEEIQMLLGKKEEPAPSSEAPAGGMSQSDIDSLIAQSKPSTAQDTESQDESDAAGSGEQEAPVTATGGGGSLDQNAIDALFKKKEEPAPAAGGLEQAAIDALMAGQDNATSSPTEERRSGAAEDPVQAELSPSNQADAGSPKGVPPEKESVEIFDATSVETPSGGLLDQSGVDDLIAGRGEPQASSADAASAPESNAPAGGSLDQDAIDQLFAGKSGGGALPVPVAGKEKAEEDSAQTFSVAQKREEPAPSSGILDQDAIDALIAKTPAAAPPQTIPDGAGSLPHSAGSGEANSAGTGASSAAAGSLDQSAIDQLIASVSSPDTVKAGAAASGFVPPNNPAPVQPAQPSQALVPHVPQVPNPLGAKTLGRFQLEGKKLLRTGVNAEVTGLRRSHYRLPHQIHNHDAALNAVLRLFSLAKAFREVGRGNHDPLGTFPNKFGHSTEIALTADQNNPVRITMKGLTKINTLRKYVETEEVFDVNYFSPAMGSQTRRWVDWFSTHYDMDTLQQIGQLSGVNP